MAYRRGWRRRGTAALALALVWLPTAITTELSLALLTESRRLTLRQIEIGTRGARSFLRWIGLDTPAHWGDVAVRWTITHWWVALPAAELVGLVGGTVLVRSLVVPVLHRLDATFVRPAAVPQAIDEGPPGPVPVTLERVRFRFPQADRDALDGVSLTVAPARLLAVVGHNGSGKSTLARIVAGRPPTAGRVERPGAAALGRSGGTAMVFQRPETQILGVRVDDDLRWGLPPDYPVDVDALLAAVGLDGFAARETATLSGGELQRLAIAAALARGPALLVSDESTTMLDPDGRRLVMDVLRGLPARGTAVVHVTHRLREAARADIVVLLDDGHLVTEGRPEEVLGEAVPAW
jgi:energy-coupling factor transport system ATP-binding protein